MDYIKIRFVDNPEGAESEFRRTVDEMLRAANPRFTLSRHRWRPQIDIYETARGDRHPGRDRRRPEGRDQPGDRSRKRQDLRHAGGLAARRDARYRLAEIPCGHFERNLSLPAPIDTEKAAALYRDGLLEIRLAKRPLDRIHRDQHPGH